MADTVAQTGVTPKLSLEGVTKVFTSNTQVVEAVQAITPHVAAGEFLCMVGSSGCGKTTLLNLIAGLEFPTTGKVLVDGKPVKGPGSDRMMMFQEHALFPWRSVIGNVLFGIEHQRQLNRKERFERARHYLDMVQLSGFEKSRIHELSGGMRQRVALARALTPEPDIILFDEPFGSLDALTRERFYAQIQEIFLRTKKTGVFVTHNVREAACLGDRVVVLTSRPGRIKREIAVPLPRPRDFYDPDVSRLAGQILGELRSELPPTGDTNHETEA